MKYLNKSSIKDFFETLQDVKNPLGDLYLSGIIVSDDQGIVNECPKDFLIIDIEKDMDQNIFLNMLKKGFSSNKWICFNIQTKNIPNFVEEQFLRIKRSNEIFIQTKNQKDFFNQIQPKDIRLFAVINKENYSSVNIDPVKSFSLFFQN